VIILEVKDLDPLVLMGIASIIIALALGFYFVKKAIRLYEIPKQAQEAERKGTQGKESCSP
jgi:cytochrome c-type biogenesis protein CcmE